MKMSAIFFGFIFIGYESVYSMEQEVIPHAHEVSVSFDCSALERNIPQYIKTIPFSIMPNLYKATGYVITSVVRRNGLQSLFKPDQLPVNFLSPEACVEYYQAMHGIAIPPDKDSELLKLIESLKTTSPEKFHVLATGVMNDVLYGQNNQGIPPVQATPVAGTSSQSSDQGVGISSASHMFNQQIDVQQVKNRTPLGVDFMQYMFKAIQDESVKKDAKASKTQLFIKVLAGFIFLQFGGLITAAVAPR